MSLPAGSPLVNDFGLYHYYVLPGMSKMEFTFSHPRTDTGPNGWAVNDSGPNGLENGLRIVYDEGPAGSSFNDYLNDPIPNAGGGLHLYGFRPPFTLSYDVPIQYVGKQVSFNLLYNDSLNRGQIVFGSTGNVAQEGQGPSGYNVAISYVRESDTVGVTTYGFGCSPGSATDPQYVLTIRHTITPTVDLTYTCDDFERPDEVINGNSGWDLVTLSPQGPTGQGSRESVIRSGKATAPGLLSPGDVGFYGLFPAASALRTAGLSNGFIGAKMKVGTYNPERISPFCDSDMVVAADPAERDGVYMTFDLGGFLAVYEVTSTQSRPLAGTNGNFASSLQLPGNVFPALYYQPGVFVDLALAYNPMTGVVLFSIGTAKYQTTCIYSHNGMRVGFGVLPGRSFGILQPGDPAYGSHVIDEFCYTAASGGGGGTPARQRPIGGPYQPPIDAKHGGARGDLLFKPGVT